MPQMFELKLPPVGVFLVAALVMWGVAELVPAAILPMPGTRYVVGLLLAAGGVAGAGGILAFLQHRTTVDPIRPHKASALVVANIYRYTRNPMYLGLALLLGAWAVYLSNLASLLVLPAFIAYITRFQIKPEERALLDKFGTDFAQYMARVRRWI